MHELKKSGTKKKKALRRGRGNSSGRGNYSTRGLKWQKARSGWSQQPGFEGGQTPLHMRLPKMRGFKRYFKLLDTYSIINLASLEHNGKISAWDVISVESLAALGFCSKDANVKILGQGDLTKKLIFKGIAKFSKSAKEKIEKSGWTIEE